MTEQLPIGRRIDITDDDALRFWMREFGVSAGELYEAIITVGSSARFVEAYFLGETGVPTPKPEK